FDVAGRGLRRRSGRAWHRRRAAGAWGWGVSAVDVPKAMRKAAFELRTVTTGNEGRVAAELDEAEKVAKEVIVALQNMVHWYAKRDGDDAVLPLEQQPDEVRCAMRALARAQGGAA